MHNRSRENTLRAKKSSYLEMRFLIPKQNAELIIGPNGSNIQRLHQKYCAMLNISGNTTAESIVTVGGFDIPTMVNMLQDVLSGLKTSLLNCRFRGDTDMIGMLLDESEVNYITGVDDYQLNQILEDSGTHIDVFLMCCPLSSDRVIRIKGEPECISMCVSSLYRLLEWCPKPANHQPYDADHANPEFAADYGGFGDDEMEQMEQTIDISFNEEDVTNKATVCAAVSSADDELNIDQRVTSILSIPSMLVGAILGKGGTRLNHIRHESMANIKLESNTRAAERILTLTGTAEEVENAKELLRLCIHHLCVRVK